MVEPSLFIDEPETKNLVLDFPNYVYALSNLILNSRPNYTIGIFGNWGTGKSTLMRNLQTQLSKRKCRWVEFNAWRYSHEERHATYPLMLTILNKLISDEKIKLSIQGGNLGKWKNRFHRIIRGLKGSLTLKIPDLLDATMDIDPKTMEENVGKQVDIDELFQQSKPLLQEGMEMITDFINEYKSNSSNSDLKMIVFIDDLDRCPPEKATEIFESVKVFFDIPGVVFVFGLSDEIIEAAINYKYQHFGDKFKGSDYLKKIIQVPFTIPAWSTDDMVDYTKAIIKNQKNDELKNFFESKIMLIVDGIEKNPREIKRVLNSFIVSRMIQKNTDISMENLLILLILAHHWRDFYSKLISEPKFLIDIFLEWNDLQDSFENTLGPSDTHEDIDKRYDEMLRRSNLLSSTNDIQAIMSFLTKHGTVLKNILPTDWRKYRRSVIIEPEIFEDKKTEVKIKSKEMEIMELDSSKNPVVRLKIPFWKHGGTQKSGNSPLFLSETEQIQIMNSESLIFQYYVPNSLTPHPSNVSHSSEVRLHISIDGELAMITPWLGFSGSSNNLLHTPIYKIKNLKSGFHSLNLQPETKESYLDNWGGTLILYESQ